MVDSQYNPGLRGDSQSVVKTGSTVTKSSGQVVKNTTKPDPAKLASQANTSMSGSNVEFGEGVKNLAKRIDRNQAGRRSMKQETTKRIQEGDFTPGKKISLPSDVKKDDGSYLGKYDQKMLKTRRKQMKRLERSANKQGKSIYDQLTGGKNTNTLKPGTKGESYKGIPMQDAQNSDPINKSIFGKNPLGIGSTKNNTSREELEGKASNGNAIVNGKILKTQTKTKTEPSSNSTGEISSNQSNADFFEIYKKEKLWDKDNLLNYFKQNPIKE